MMQWLFILIGILHGLWADGSARPCRVGDERALPGGPMPLESFLSGWYAIPSVCSDLSKPPAPGRRLVGPGGQRRCLLRPAFWGSVARCRGTTWRPLAARAEGAWLTRFREEDHDTRCHRRGDYYRGALCRPDLHAEGLLDHLRRRDAESEAKEIVRQAQQEVENRRREAELEIKEQTIQAQGDSEKELRRLRGELHERERLLDKRQDALEEQAEQIRKQEKIVEGTQRKLTEKIQDSNRRKEELSKLLDLQRQTLHELSGLSREEATKRLLELLDMQLQQETGALILRHEKRIAESCEAEVARGLAHLPAALRRRPHRPRPPPAPWAFPTTR